MFVENHKENSDSERHEWIRDLQEDILLNEWRKICLKTHTQTINTRLRIIQFNRIMRTYISPVQLNEFDSNILDLCYKCNSHQGILFHCLWKCEEIKKFWCSVIRYISQITTSPVPFCPKLCILGIYPDDCPLSCKERKMVDLCLLQAKRRILVAPLLSTG